MRKCLLLFILTTFTQVVFVQFLDNFSDGELTNNLIGNGDVGVFEVEGLADDQNLTAGLMEVFSEDRTTERFKQVLVLSR